MLCLNIGKPNDNQYKLCLRDKVCKAKVGEQDMKEIKWKLRFSSEAEVQKKKFQKPHSSFIHAFFFFFKVHQPEQAGLDFEEEEEEGMD